MKYFFLSEGWTVARVWAADGLWQEIAWRRKPDIQKINIRLASESEILWLYRVEDAVLTVEVKRMAAAPVSQNTQVIGQVVLKRLITAEQLVERLSAAEAICHLKNIQSVVQ